MVHSADIAVVPFERDLDVTTVAEARRLVDALVGNDCKRVVLNLANVSHVDSAGMGLIISLLKRVRAQGGILSLSCVSADVYHALAVLRIVDLMPVSLAGPRPAVPQLGPDVAPLWRTSFGVQPSDMASARSRLGELLLGVPLTPDEAFDVRLAVGEAIGNAVDHTMGKGIVTTVAAYPDRVVIDVSDTGAGFDEADASELPEVDPCGERGRGISLMHLLVDSVSISRKAAGTGTVVRLVKLVGAR